MMTGRPMTVTRLNRHDNVNMNAHTPTKEEKYKTYQSFLNIF